MNEVVADVIVIGAGIAGASAAFELSSSMNVILLEQEFQPGYHATGRSAALFSELYGDTLNRALVRASHPFFDNPPEGFTEHSLLTKTGALFCASAVDTETIDELYKKSCSLSDIALWDESLIRAKIPLLRAGVVDHGIWEPNGAAIDVHGLLQGYLKGFRRNEGKLIAGSRVNRIETKGRHFAVFTEKGECFRARSLVNAAGAWADDIAELAGARPAGLTPKRRTVIMISSPASADISGWPFFELTNPLVYFKPDAGQLLVSPEDATPDTACDCQPDEIDVAVTAERLMSVLDIDIRKINHKWAGLRTFAPDGEPVVGEDPDVPGFFWLAGQGGYGVQTSVPLARIMACMVTGQSLPENLEQIYPDLLRNISPLRFQ